MPTEYEQQFLILPASLQKKEHGNIAVDRKTGNRTAEPC